MNLVGYIKKWKPNRRKIIGPIILIIIILSSFGYPIILAQVNNIDENETPPSQTIRESSTYNRQAAIDYADAILTITTIVAVVGTVQILFLNVSSQEAWI